MSEFNLAIPIILRHEGGFVNDAADPGGATNFGVSLRWLKSQGLIDDLIHETGADLAIQDRSQEEVLAVHRISVDEAKAFYQKFWWDAYHYGTFIAQAVASKVFDMAVNLGAPRAHKMLQHVIGAAVDGILGQASYAAANNWPSVPLLTSLQNVQADFYRAIVSANPARTKFLAGWLKRAYDQC